MAPEIDELSKEDVTVPDNSGNGRTPVFSGERDDNNQVFNKVVSEVLDNFREQAEDLLDAAYLAVDNYNPDEVARIISEVDKREALLRKSQKLGLLPETMVRLEALKNKLADMQGDDTVDENKQTLKNEVNWFIGLAEEEIKTGDYSKADEQLDSAILKVAELEKNYPYDNWSSYLGIIRDLNSKMLPYSDGNPEVDDPGEIAFNEEFEASFGRAMNRLKITINRYNDGLANVAKVEARLITIKDLIVLYEAYGISIKPEHEQMIASAEAIIRDYKEGEGKDKNDEAT